MRSKIIFSTVLMLLTLGANAQKVGYEERIYDAIRDNEVKTALKLIRKAKSIDFTSDYGEDILWRAATSGELEIVQELIKKGADVNSFTVGSTPLSTASFKGYLEIVQELIKNGADVNLQNIEGETALTEAAYGDNLEILQELIKNGADINLKWDGFGTALAIASLKGCLEIAQELIKNGADVNLQNKGGNTALALASSQGCLEIAQELIKNGADVNLQDKGGKTALTMAAYGDNLEIVQELIKNGADVNLQDNIGTTALAIASLKGYLEIAQELIKNDADVELQNNNGETALTMALKSKKVNYDVVSQLFESEQSSEPEEDLKSESRVIRVAGTNEFANSGQDLYLIPYSKSIELLDREVIKESSSNLFTDETIPLIISQSSKAEFREESFHFENIISGDYLVFSIVESQIPVKEEESYVDKSSEREWKYFREYNFLKKEITESDFWGHSLFGKSEYGDDKEVTFTASGGVVYKKVRGDYPTRTRIVEKMKDVYTKYDKKVSIEPNINKIEITLDIN